MKPIHFDQSNRTLRGGLSGKFGTESDVPDLAVFMDGAQILSCWEPTDEERQRIADGGNVWLRVWSTITHEPVEVTGKDPWQ